MRGNVDFVARLFECVSGTSRGGRGEDGRVCLAHVASILWVGDIGHIAATDATCDDCVRTYANGCGLVGDGWLRCNQPNVRCLQNTEFDHPSDGAVVRRAAEPVSLAEYERHNPSPPSPLLLLAALAAAASASTPAITSAPGTAAGGVGIDAVAAVAGGMPRPLKEKEHGGVGGTDAAAAAVRWLASADSALSRAIPRDPAVPCRGYTKRKGAACVADNQSRSLCQ